MRRVLLVATTTGYQTRSFTEAAERLGVEIVFATDRCHQLEDPWRDSAIPVRFYEEADSVAAIVEAARRRPILGILAVGDRPTVIAALAAEKLGLPGHSPAAAEASRNKLLTRERLRAAGLTTPWFRMVPLGEPPAALAAELSFPCVVKPLALSGSRGVIRANGPAEFIEAFERLRRLLRQTDVRAMRDPANDAIMIEGFVPGREFALEGLIERGRLRTLALFDKPDPLDGPFFEETTYVTPSLLPGSEQREIEAAVSRGAAALGLSHGPIHAECRVDESVCRGGTSLSAREAACLNAPGARPPGADAPRHPALRVGSRLAPLAHGSRLHARRGPQALRPPDVVVLEVAARPIGGLCARALRFVDPAGDTMAFEELLLRHALGESSELFAREPRASAVMMIPIPRRGVYRKVEQLDEALAVAGVEEIRVTAKPDQVLIPLPEGASYLGFIFARTERPEEAVAAVRAAHERLQFVIDPALAVV